MRALFIRHGQSVANADPETPALPAEAGDRLSDLGHRQSRAAGEVLADAGATVLITSTMRRARETAEEMNAALGLPVTELGFIQELRVEDDDLEPFAEVVARVHRLKAVLEALPPDELPLIVSHGIFLRFFLFDTLLGDAFGPEGIEQLWRARSLNCGLSIFECGERWPTLNPPSGDWTCISWMARPWDPPPRL